MKHLTIEELYDQEKDWFEREGLDEGDDRNAWLMEGVQLYKQFIQLDKKESNYSIQLANLYLEIGRDEKRRRGNYFEAYKTLRMATIHSPSVSDAYYHLSFIMADQDRKWEAAIFYGKEALEKGVGNGRRKIRLLCNIALGYSRLGYIIKGQQLMEEAFNLDDSLEQEWFINLYKDRMKKKRSEPILLKEEGKKRKEITKQDSRKLKEEAMDGKCVVLDLIGDEKYFYANKDALRLEKREGEILGFLIDQRMTSCSKQKIEEAVWHDSNVGSSAVKRYISGLRKKLTHAMGRDDIAEVVLATTPSGYEWKADIKSIVLRRV